MSTEPSKFSKLIAERVRFIREYEKLSREEFSKKANISLEHLTECENGNGGNIPGYELAQICNAFPISINTLFSDISLDKFENEYKNCKYFSQFPESIKEIIRDVLKEASIEDLRSGKTIATIIRKYTNGDEEKYNKYMERYSKLREDKESR